ncbi:hypothetical protein [Cetobacterium sp.]
MRTFKLFLLLMVVCFTRGYSYINVYPYRVYLDVEKNLKNEEIILYNKTSKPVRYKFSIKDEELKEIVSFYPQVITVGSGEEKKIKLKLENNWKKFNLEEHSSEILIEQLRVPVKDSKGNFVQSTGFEVYPKVKIPLKIYLGNEKMVLEKNGKTVLKNISGRELNFEIFYKKIKKDKKDPLGFIKSIRLKNEEEIDLNEDIEHYRENNKVVERIELKNLEIYEKFSNRLVEIK